MSVKHAPWTRGYIYIVSLGDALMWKIDFLNCHFGFTAKVSSFNNPQIEALRAFPYDRILLETDSPYMPVNRHHRTNIPAYLDDIARMVAHWRSCRLSQWPMASESTNNPNLIVCWGLPRNSLSSGFVMCFESKMVLLKYQVQELSKYCLNSS